jgi:hypothetical protein
MLRIVSIVSAALLATGAAFAQASPAASPEPFKLESEPNADGATLVKVLQPEGAQLKIFEGRKSVHEDDIPTTYRATPDIFYRLVVQTKDGRSWEKKLSFARATTSSLTVVLPAATEEHNHAHHEAPPASPLPQAMSEKDFNALKADINHEDFEHGKMNALQAAASTAYFNTSQVGQLIDVFDFSAAKVKVIELTHGHLMDQQNAYQLLTHLQFESDKRKAKAILGL